MANDAIAAVATPAGRGGVAVIRLSGPNLRPLLGALINTEIAPRHATLAKFHDKNGAIIDHGIALFFPAPRSYTGEDVVEIQAHGGPVVVQMLLARCLELGARLAEPGEFTKRAFLNDKLDLAQAESVADLINATTAEAVRCAVRSLEGEFSKRIDALGLSLTNLRVLVEATLDFPEEEIDLIEKSGLKEKLANLRGAITAVTDASRQGSLLREGIQVVLAGQPNVGKSSLLNKLAGAERAIVTDIPGTTRDAIRESISIRGVPLHLVDTAGLRDARDPVEEIGIARSHDAISKADIVLWVADATRPETYVIDGALADSSVGNVTIILVINKIDLVDASSEYKISSAAAVQVKISAHSGEGLDALKDEILRSAGWADGESVFLARARHLQALNLSAAHVDAAIGRMAQLELCAEELRLAQIALASITGVVSADDLLGKIFSQFCIGK
jgi:tRNA modification GTPase